MVKILLTNDDGILADGLEALYKPLKQLGEVLVAAPDSQRSSVSHAITLLNPLRCRKFYKNNKFFGYGLNGYPADCVKFAKNVLLKDQLPDLVVSGINLGPNEGCSVHYSGTVAGAREGALLGIPSIAVSLDTFAKPDYSTAAAFVRKLAQKILTDKKFPKGSFLNVNVPNKPASKIKGVKFLHQGRISIHGSFKQYKDPHEIDYYWMTGEPPAIEPGDSSDIWALRHNYITVTPIHTDSTDYKLLERIRHWKIK